MQAVFVSGLWLCHRKQIVDCLPAASYHLQFVLSTAITLFWTSWSLCGCEKVMCLLNILFTVWLAAKPRTYLRANNAPHHHILKRAFASVGWLAPAVHHTGPVLYLWGFEKEGSALWCSWRSFLSFYLGIGVTSSYFLKKKGISPSQLLLFLPSGSPHKHFQGSTFHGYEQICDYTSAIS